MNASTMENKQPRNEMTTCPSDRQLSDYLCGQLSSVELQALDEHLPTCGDCAARLRRAEQQDESLIEALKDTTCEDSNPVGKQAAEAAALKAALALQLPTASAQPLSSVGAYELLESIGSGGMGNVYLARHKSLNKRVAIKLLPLRWTPHRDDLMRRFEREIRAAGALEHPAIVAAHDAGMDAQVHYLVMDYVDGVDLAQVARAVDRLDIADAAAIGLQVAQGLAYAHAKGIVHRDIKPSNIMLDRNGQVRILDFGLVLMDPWEESASELTTVGQFLGTLDYMAPEQAERSGAVDYRADLYALGATLFRLLTGRAPLAAAPNLSPLEKLRLLAHHNPPSLRSLRPDAPAPLIRVVDQLLKTAPQDRPSSATAVAEVLEPLSMSANLKTLIQEVSQRRTTLVKNDALPATRLPGNLASQSGRGKWWGWRQAIVVAALPLALLAGIGITLMTDRGTLVIESDDPDVQLEIVRDGNRSPVKDFQLRQDGQQLVLGSGEYEIRLKNATGDRLSLDRNRVLITRGDREVVRITRQPESEEAVVDNRERPSLYKGRSFSEWMDVLEQERSMEGVWDAIIGGITLAEPDQQRSVAQASLVATRQYGSFFATEALMQPGAFQAVSDSEDFMGKLKRHYWTLDTGAALAALLEELQTRHPRSTQACVALVSELDRVRLGEHARLVKQIRDELTQVDFQEVARDMANGSPTSDLFAEQPKALVFNEVLRLTRVLDEPIASVPPLADWFAEYLSQSQVASLNGDWLRAAIELDLLDRVPVLVLAQTILGSNPTFAPSMAQDVQQMILRSREQGRGEQLAVALETQILRGSNFGGMGGMQASNYLPPIAPLAELLVQSASDRASLADGLEARLTAIQTRGHGNAALGGMGGMDLPNLEEQLAFQKDLIKRLRDAQ